MFRILLITLILFPLFGIAQSGAVATDGVYVPRLSTVQRNAIATPVNGQMIYNTDDDCFNLYQKDAWQKLCGMNMEVSQSDDWVRKGDFGTTRVGAVGFSIGGKGYIGTGATTVGGSSLADFWEYNPATDVWTQRANFGGGGRKDAVGFAIGNKGYVGTGGTSDFWEYNPASNAWTSKAAVGGGARSGAVGFSMGSKGYIGTGSSKEDFWEYDTTANAWSQKANVGGGIRTNAVGFTIGNRGYIGTGISGTTKKADFWEYDPIANNWTQKANFGGTARTGASGFVIHNKGYIGTGNDGAANNVTPENDLWEYSPATNTWTEKRSFWRTGRIDGIGFSIGNKGYMGLGYDINRSDEPYATKDFWEYTTNITSLAINGNLSIGGLLNSPDFIAPTLLNNWVNFGGDYSTAGYYKDKESVVHLKGFIKSGTTTQNTNLFSLPFGYHPSQTRVFTVASGDGTFGRVNITPLGYVQFYSGVNTYLSLDGISFRAED